MLLLCCNLLFSISIKIASVSETCLPFTKYFFIASPSLDYLAYNVTTNPLLSAQRQASRPAFNARLMNLLKSSAPMSFKIPLTPTSVFIFLPSSVCPNTLMRKFELMNFVVNSKTFEFDFFIFSSLNRGAIGLKLLNVLLCLSLKHAAKILIFFHSTKTFPERY